jgi:dCMP deaminase
MVNEFDIRMLQKAYEVAIRRSTDKSTQNGAVLIPATKNTGVSSKLVRKPMRADEILEAANCFPHYVKDLPERHARPLKYAFVEHAERNVIFLAANRGVSTMNSTMYVPWFACADCARAIIQSGVARVVGHNTPVHHERKDWEELIKHGMTMLKEAGVRMEYYTGEIGVEFLFDGKLVRV